MNPIPVIAMILILLSPQALRAGWAFLAAWLAALVGMGIVVMLIGNRTFLYDSGYSSPAARLIKAIVGVLLLFLAIRKWLGRPRVGEEVVAPAWMDKLTSVAPRRAAVLGAGLAAANPKNIGLTIAAAASVVETGLTVPAEVGVMVLFTLASSIGAAVPLGAYVTLGETAPTVLSRWGAWLTRRNAVIMSIVLAVIAVVLLVGAVTG